VGFPGGSDGKASACNVGDLGSIPGLGRSPGEGNGNLLQYSCLENFMDGGAWWATVHGVAKSQTWLSDFTFTFLKWGDQSLDNFLNKAEVDVFLEFLAFSVIQRMLVIWSLVPLPFLNPPWASGSSRFMHCWSLAWRILSITLLACKMHGITFYHLQKFYGAIQFCGRDTDIKLKHTTQIGTWTNGLGLEPNQSLGCVI